MIGLKVLSKKYKQSETKTNAVDFLFKRRTTLKQQIIEGTSNKRSTGGG